MTLFGLDFFSPIYFHHTCFVNDSFSPYLAEDGRNSRGPLEEFTEKIDRYLKSCFHLRHVAMITGTPECSYSCTVIPENSLYRCWKSLSLLQKVKRIIRIISYFLVLPILVALIIKFILRVMILYRYRPCRIIQPPDFQLSEYDATNKNLPHEIHSQLYALAELHGSFEAIPQEELDELGIIIHTGANNQDSSMSRSQVSFTFSEGPLADYVFHSVSSFQATSMVSVFLLARSLVLENNLNLLRIPEINIMPKSLSTEKGTRILIVEEKLPLLLKEQSDGLPDEYNSHFISARNTKAVYSALSDAELLPSLRQFLTFIRKSLYANSFLLSDLPILAESGPNGEPIIGLMGVSGCSPIFMYKRRMQKNYVSYPFTKWIGSNHFRSSFICDSILYNNFPCDVDTEKDIRGAVNAKLVRETALLLKNNPTKHPLKTTVLTFVKKTCPEQLCTKFIREFRSTKKRS